jgi:hypothetical protein
VCDIRQHDWQIPPRPADCQQTWGDRFLLAEGQAAVPVCHSGTLLSGQPTQDDGRSVSAGAITCEVDEKLGVTCMDSTSHFFQIGREEYRLN